MRSGVSALILAAAAAACSDDSPRSTDTADAGGGRGATGGAGGSGGSAGSAGVRDAAGGTSGSSGSGGNAGSAGTTDGGDGGFSGPEKLSETGLYADIVSGTLAEGVEEFRPAYELWSDGAVKRRFLYVPTGTRIDTADMDYWVYPAGTKVWKEFVRDGVRIETRLLFKFGPTPKDWFAIAYQWNEALTDAVAVPDGVKNASGTTHDIPRQQDCAFCHEGLKDRLLGVTAIQLSHALGGLTIDTLIERNALTSAPATPLVIPGSATDRAALGYLHANCGICHNPSSLTGGNIDLNLWLTTGSLATVHDTVSYRTTVNVPTTSLAPVSAPLRITPSNPATSSVHARMNVRGSGIMMPPLASEIVDTEGVQAIAAWIEAL